MLVLKKMAVKKIAIYSSVIFVMLGGTGLMLYQNYKLTNNRAGVINAPAQYNTLMQTGAAGPAAVPPAADTRPAGIQPVPAAGSQAVSGQSLDVNKLKNNSGLDITIFSSEKFKALKENAIASQGDPDTGKRDPFQPD